MAEELEEKVKLQIYGMRKKLEVPLIVVVPILRWNALCRKKTTNLGREPKGEKNKMHLLKKKFGKIDRTL